MMQFKKTRDNTWTAVGTEHYILRVWSVGGSSYIRKEAIAKAHKKSMTKKYYVFIYGYRHVAFHTLKEAKEYITRETNNSIWAQPINIKSRKRIIHYMAKQKVSYD